MSKVLPAAVTEAQKTGRPVLELNGDNGEKYYFYRPGAKDIERFVATATKGKALQAVRNLVTELAIHPTGSDLAAEFQENPGRLVALNSALQASVGMNEDFTAKKL